MMTTKALVWDSRLFGYPVGLIELDGETLSKQTLCQEAAQFRLVYVTSRTRQRCGLLKCEDTKLIFGKEPQQHGLDKEVVDMPLNRISQAVQLGLQSGPYSRFNLDNGFVNGEFEKLYAAWAKRSIHKEIAYRTLTVLRDNRPAGIITLGEEREKVSSIGLLAVDTKNRGQGIGIKLLKAADTLSFYRGDSRLVVATQGKNKGACKVYENFGFKLISETYIYNYWNEEFRKGRVKTGIQ